MDDDRTDRFLRDFTPEPSGLAEARTRLEQQGFAPVAVETGALFAWCARLVGARHAVEIGTGGGYRALWTLSGMDPRGTLTTLDADIDQQAAAQAEFAEAGVTDRVRSMLGPATSVLPKLADDHYELVVLDAGRDETLEQLAHAKRLLRPGGLLLADNALPLGEPMDADPGARVASDPAPPEGDAGAFAAAVRDDPELDATVAPVGAGVLMAVYRPQGGP